MGSEQLGGARRIRRVLSTRAGGASAAPYDSFNLGRHVGDDERAVLANRARLADALALAPERLVWMEQVHGRGVRVVDGPQPAPVEMTDAVVTATPGIGLNVLSADCVPVLLWDAAAGVIGAVHAGRQGVRLDIATATVEAMRGLGARPERIEALLGAAVCGACYEVPAALQQDVEQAAPGSAVRTRQGTAGLDLRAGLAGQLARAGVENVQVDPRCTAEDPSLYSYRRDGRTGRQTAVIWIEEDR
ncbi:peptidoglycan editing factor PgeF [Cumulibacter manganitolerans]|uniref:peptidoglycan editing factor PgeF n=1 Tax=Cumulibacter manganitolerans TaxID=1884992 RepID=UPI001296E237|nr:peptidoglycan editing factor PgeF [Cumulibacter manganitolerans]